MSLQEGIITKAAPVFLFKKFCLWFLVKFHKYNILQDTLPPPECFLLPLPSKGPLLPHPLSPSIPCISLYPLEVIIS